MSNGILFTVLHGVWGIQDLLLPFLTYFIGQKKISQNFPNAEIVEMSNEKY